MSEKKILKLQATIRILKVEKGKQGETNNTLNNHLGLVTKERDALKEEVTMLQGLLREANQ